jgi:serine phosphatase RsbU (regulator of sigma subunit)
MCSCVPLFAQDTDSLEASLKGRLHDTVRLNTLLQLSNNFRFADPAKGKTYSHMAVVAALKTGNQKALGEAYHYLASSFFQVAAYDSSEKYNQQALAVRLRINDEKGLAASYTNLGQLYGDRGRSQEGFDLLHKAEKIYRKLNMERHLSLVYNSLGNLYYEQKLYELAFKAHKQSYAVRLKINDEEGQIASLNNIGHATYYLYGADSARPYYLEAVKRAMQSGDVYKQVQSLNNLGAFYIDTEDRQKAITTLKKAIDIGEGTEYEELLGNAYMNYAKLLLQVKKDRSQALHYALKAEKIINTQNLPGQTYQAQNMIASIYSLTGDYKKAYDYMYNAYITKDTFIRQSVQDQLASLEAKYEGEKKQLEIENLKQQEKLNAAKLDVQTSELNRRSLQLVLVAVLALFFLVMGYILWKAYGQKRKANLEISQQKELLELKNTEILDSITYAKRLQDAILPPVALLKSHLPQSFVLYLPKDIIAGDFYWLHANSEDDILVAVADCTGHGVPGAMVSVVCSTALDRALKEFGIREPGKVLDKVTELVLETFEKSESQVNDGMDISLCRIRRSKESCTVEWAGANNPLWYSSDGTMKEIKANKQAIGKNERQQKFDTHQIELNKGDLIYLFSDGYADQFGMTEEKWAEEKRKTVRSKIGGKKFKYRQLQDLLTSIRSNEMEEQKVILEQRLKLWQGELEQVDDVCIIGIRV